MTMRKRIMPNGFTLLEIMVSVGILGIVSVLVAQSFFSSVRSNTKVEILKEVKQNGDFALDTMVSRIRKARTVTCDSATQLTVTNPNSSVTTLGCVVDAGITRIASASATTDYLTSSDVTIGGTDCSGSTLVMSCTSTSGVPTRVDIAFTLTSTTSSPDAIDQGSVDFATSVSLRN